MQGPFRPASVCQGMPRTAFTAFSGFGRGFVGAGPKSAQFRPRNGAVASVPFVCLSVLSPAGGPAPAGGRRPRGSGAERSGALVPFPIQRLFFLLGGPFGGPLRPFPDRFHLPF